VEGTFDIKKIVKYYCDWINSMPFGIFLIYNFLDIGSTIGNAFYLAYGKSDCEPKLMQNRAKNIDSHSNGFLMKISPLAVYLSKLQNIEKFIEIIKAEVSLTHSNKTMQELAICYCMAIKGLINGNSREKSYEISKYFFIGILSKIFN